MKNVPKHELQSLLVVCIARKGLETNLQMQLNLANQTVLLFVRRLCLNVPVILRFGAKLNLASTGIDLQIVSDELDCKMIV